MMRVSVFVLICIALAHGEVLDLTGQAVTQKSLFKDNVPGHAIDGDLTTASCTAITTSFPWWSVKLPDGTQVTSVTITKATEDIVDMGNLSASEGNLNPPDLALKNLRVGVTDVDPSLQASGDVAGWFDGQVGVGASQITFSQTCGYFEGLVGTDEVTIHCTAGCVAGKYLVIQIAETSRTEDKDLDGQMLAMTNVQVEAGTDAECSAIADDSVPLVDPFGALGEPTDIWNHYDTRNRETEAPAQLEAAAFDMDVTPGMSAPGAECHMSLQDLHDCQQQCFEMDSCLSIDWNHLEHPWGGCHCWIHTVEPGPMSPNANVDHYTKH